ncbi:MAG: hypothetical protein IKR46_00140 [Clostridia bacterium]|nr:hypothetical protein [Clostridia bacterium]
MGLFFNYDKEGPGVDKYAPKKKGIFLYFELFFRKFWLLIKANLLYFAVSLPVMAVYNIIIMNALTAFLPTEYKGMEWQWSLILTAIVTILWGTGPVTAGYTYLLRNFAREEHIWLTSDFFEKSKECFKLGITVLLTDIAVMFLGINAASVYIAMIKSGASFARFALGVLIFLLIIHTFMHYYIYEFGVTFENRIRKTLKNAYIMAIATIPANLFLTLFVLIFTFFAFSPLAPFAIILLLFILWISFMRFPIDFYTARLIKRRFIDEKNGEN